MIVVTCHTFAIVAVTPSRVTIRRRITDRRQYSHRMLYRFCHVQKKNIWKHCFHNGTIFFVLQCNRDSLIALSWKECESNFRLVHTVTDFVDFRDNNFHDSYYRTKLSSWPKSRSGAPRFTPQDRVVALADNRTVLSPTRRLL